jgi:hypothetical protein
MPAWLWSVRSLLPALVRVRRSGPVATSSGSVDHSIESSGRAWRTALASPLAPARARRARDSRALARRTIALIERLRFGPNSSRWTLSGTGTRWVAREPSSPM